MPTQKDNSISIAKLGMNKDSHISNLQENEYRHAKNSNFWEEGGEGYNLQNEHSNILASKFKEGFKVIGKNTVINDNITYFFLKNPSSGVSEIGKIFNTTKLDSNIGGEIQSYITLLKDDCNQCLNFNIEYPIKTSVFKDEKFGKILYWTDNFNEPRFIEVDDLDQYKRKGEVLCGEDLTDETCVDCEKIKIFKESVVPILDPTEIVLGGNLKRGVYQATLAYCDEAGNEQSRYFTVSEPVSIFDNQNKILESNEISDETNYALKIKVSNLDKRFTHYKVVVIQNADISKATSYIEEGIHSTSDNTVLYTTDQNKNRASLDRLVQFAVRVEKLEKIETANNYLLGKGITYKKRANLQKVVNLIGAFVQWQSHIATENLYKDGVNAAKFRQFTRDENYPLALRFIEDGEYSPTFPMIGRRAGDFDLQKIDNKDSDSINKSGSTCSSSKLDTRWQLYNTAEELGRFEEVEDIEYVDVNVTERQACTTPDISFLPSGTISVDLEEGDVFVNLETYLKENIDDILNADRENLSEQLKVIQDLFNVSRYSTINCTPQFNAEGENFCSENITLLDEFIEFSEVGSENIKFIPAVFPLEYPTLKFPSFCQADIADTQNPGYYGGSRDVFCRDMRILAGGFGDRNCDNALSSEFPYETDPSLSNVITPSQDLRTEENSYFVNYFFALEEADLLTTKDATPATGKDKIDGKLRSEWNPGFTYDNFLYKNARWFELNAREVGDYFTVFISRDSVPDVGVLETREYRINIYDSIADSAEPIFTTVKSLREEMKIQIRYRDDLGFEQTVVEENDGSNWNSSASGGKLRSTYYMSIDTPYQQMSTPGAIEDNVDQFKIPEEVDGSTVYSLPRWLNFRSSGCFNVATFGEINKSVDIDYTNLKVSKVQEYETECVYQEPVINDDCKAIPYAFGKMAYTESTETYPDNAELYDSSDLKISPDDIPDNVFYEQGSNLVTFKDFFENNFTEGIENGNYKLSEDLDFRCKNIRHFKFPDNKASNYTYDITLPNYSNSFIFPLGVKLDGRIVSSFLDIAVKNGLLTSTQRKSIQGFELLRGDRAAEKSVIAKGITFDLYDYEKNSRKISYANYPLNSLGDDTLHYKDSSRTSFIPHPYESEGNTKWTFTSPETDYNQISVPPIMKVEGYSFGSTTGNIDLVEDHPKWTILGRRLQNTASTLATIEVVAEAVIQSMEAFANLKLDLGVAQTTVFHGAFVATPVIAAFNTITAAVFKYARYKYEWLEIFRNLGKRRNFAAYYTTVGKLNRMETLQEEGDSLRFLNIRDNISSGRSIFTDNIAGERIELNHVDREKTVLLSTGSNFDLSYPLKYTRNDNASFNPNKSSKTFSSQASACSNGLSKDIERNTSSMYVSLKNFLPSQYGTIGSVKWIPVNQRGILNKNNLFFGGDTFICRHTLRRPFPFFLSTAFDQADMTPYEYKFYTNIGEEPRFFVNFQTDSEEREGGTTLPFKNSEYSLDCLDNRSSYIKEPSKFYLYNNGIPSFLTESTINTNYRYAKPEPWNNFYPNESDYMRWTQQKENPIRRGNSFFYNNEYSLQTLPTGVLTLPDIYNQKDYDARTDAPNGIIYSLPDNSENNFIDPWLIFRPNDKYEFPTKYGKLNAIKGIESEQVLTIFDNTTAIFNAVDQLVDDGQNPQTRETGLGGIFARRPRVFTETSLGYAGSQHYPILSCEYGHFFLDAERGHVFQIPPGGKGIEEISSSTNEEPTGMENWFKENLPFKIKNEIPEIDIDNPFNGVGIAMGYDSRYKRVFITKKDYLPESTEDICVNSNGAIFDNSEVQSIINTYEDQGFTFVGQENCKLNFSRTVEAIAPGTTIIAVQDSSGSFSANDRNEISQTLNQFVSTFNSNLDSNEEEIVLHEVDTSNERWLSYIDLVDDYFGESNKQVEDVILITFCNEAYSSYHGAIFTDPSRYASEGQIPNYLEDYSAFIDYIEQFSSFKSIAYPIIVSGPQSKPGKTLLEQTLFAYFGRNATQEQVNSIKRNSAFTDQEWQTLLDQLTTDNPYNVEGLESYGWTVQTDLNDLGESIINIEQFSSNVTRLLQQSETSVENVQVPLPRKDFSEFKDVSWTISFSLKTKKWTSFFDFKPNYYIEYNNYFQTGVNSNNSENGLWSHLLTNKSYQNFYGKDYKWEIEIPVQNKGNKRALESISYQLDSRKYQNERDFIQNKELGFEDTYVFNNSNLSGKLKLNLQRTLRDLSKYPINGEGFQEILQTQQDGIMRFNYFYNRVADEFSGIPLFVADENGVDKEINEEVIAFTGKKVLERLRGDSFLVNLSTDETEHKKIFKLAKFNSNLYNK